MTTQSEINYHTQNYTRSKQKQKIAQQPYIRLLCKLEKCLSQPIFERKYNNLNSI